MDLETIAGQVVCKVSLKFLFDSMSGKLKKKSEKPLNFQCVCNLHCFNTIFLFGGLTEVFPLLCVTVNQ